MFEQCVFPNEVSKHEAAAAVQQWEQAMNGLSHRKIRSRLDSSPSVVSYLYLWVCVLCLTSLKLKSYNSQHFQTNKWWLEWKKYYPTIPVCQDWSLSVNLVINIMMRYQDGCWVNSKFVPKLVNTSRLTSRYWSNWTLPIILKINILSQTLGWCNSGLAESGW